MKKRLTYLLLFSLLLFLSRHWLFEKTVSFQPLTERPAYTISDTSFHQYLAKPKSGKDIESIIRDAVDLTAHRLSFASQNTEVDPNLSFHGKRAHCVGYAAFLATACNFLLDKNGMADEWAAKHMRGKMYFLGIDLHQFSDSAFFRDHDFNLVENKKTGERYLVDSSVRDVLGIRFLNNQMKSEY